MAVDKGWALGRAVEITKEAARGGAAQPELILKDVYKQLVELLKDIDTPE